MFTFLAAEQFSCSWGRDRWWLSATVKPRTFTGTNPCFLQKIRIIRSTPRFHYTTCVTLTTNTLLTLLTNLNNMAHCMWFTLSWGDGDAALKWAPFIKERCRMKSLKVMSSLAAVFASARQEWCPMFTQGKVLSLNSFDRVCQTGHTQLQTSSKNITLKKFS